MKMTVLAAVALVVALSSMACGHGDCEPENCGDFCSDVGATAPDPAKDFEDCVENVGSTGGDLVLVGDDGTEAFRCRDEHDELGQQVGTCVDDFTAAKSAYCGC